MIPGVDGPSDLKRSYRGRDVAFQRALGAAMKRLRKAAKTKAITVAAEIGTKPQNVSYWENGKVAVPIHHLRLYARVIGVPAWQIMRLAEGLVALDRTMGGDREAQQRRQVQKRQDQEAAHAV